MTKVCFRFLQEYSSVFSASCASLNPMLQSIPKTSHFNTDDRSTKGFRRNQAPWVRAECKQGKSPGQDPQCPTKASDSRHISKSQLYGKTTEVTASLSELQPTLLWPHY